MPKFGSRSVLRIIVEARISLVILTDEAKVEAVGLKIVIVPVLIPEPVTRVLKDDMAVLTLLFTNIKELTKALGKLRRPISTLHAIKVDVIKELTFKSVSIVKNVLIWPKLLIVLMRAVLAMKFFVEIPGKKLKVLTCEMRVLRVLTPWPKFIVLAPRDKAVLILLKGIGMISCKELSADIVVLNEEEPRELNCVIEVILKRRSPFIT